MINVIIVVIVVAIVLLGVRAQIKHMKGEGSCCGGGGGTIAEEPKKLEGELVGKKIVHIEGMHCENCKNSVERQINHLDGAAATVNLAKNEAVVSMTRMVSDDELRQAVAMADFKATDITFQEA